MASVVLDMNESSNDIKDAQSLLIGGICLGSDRPVSGKAIAIIGGDCWGRVLQFVPVPHIG